MVRNRASSPSSVTELCPALSAPASGRACAEPVPLRATAMSPKAAMRNGGTLGPHLRGLALETPNGEGDVVDRGDLFEHLGRNADTEARLDVGHALHDAQAVEAQIVLNVVGRTDLSPVVHVTAQQIA